MDETETNKNTLGDIRGFISHYDAIKVNFTSRDPKVITAFASLAPSNSTDTLLLVLPILVLVK